LYLVDEENRIITTGYVNGNFLFFDVIKDYILQQDKVKDLYVKAIIRQPTNKNQI
jgi:hypothetical protein